MPTDVAKRRVRNRLTDQDCQVSNVPFGLEDSGVAGIDIAPSAWEEPTIRAIGELLQLGPGWDSYGAPPVDPRCAVAALELANSTFLRDTPAPSVVPTSRGGLQFEWHMRGVDLEVEFLSATHVCGFFDDQITGTSWEKDLTFDLRSLVGAISTLSQRR